MAFFIFTSRCYHYSLVVSCPLTACYLCPLIRTCHRESVWCGYGTHTGSGGGGFWTHMPTLDQSHLIVINNTFNLCHTLHCSESQRATAIKKHKAHNVLGLLGKTGVLYCMKLGYRYITILNVQMAVQVKTTESLYLHLHLPGLLTFRLSLVVWCIFTCQMYCASKKGWVLLTISAPQCLSVGTVSLTDCRVLLIWRVERRLNQGSDSAVSSQYGCMQPG